MNLFYASINSGSNGNCYYVGNENNAVLVDAGIHLREIEKRMQRIRLDLNKVRAVFVTHEHSDHIRGLSSLASKYNIPVYLTQGTFRKLSDDLKKVTYRYILDENPIIIEDLLIHPFKKIHDAAAPVSFVVEFQKTKVGVITDIGRACENVIKHFGKCHASFLEANYDRNMLLNGRYPAQLKERIMGGEGHISNHEALDLFLNHRGNHLSHLILSHLSEENNDSEEVYNLFWPHANGVRINVASRYSESKLYVINKKKKPVAEEIKETPQLALF
jgi:phosphoribosyl 1,2-cyclic phosphodiesterase